MGSDYADFLRKRFSKLPVDSHESEVALLLGNYITVLQGNERTFALCDPFMFWIQQPFGDTGVGLNGGCLPTSAFRILVVDDFEPWRQQICSMLQTRPELCVVAEVGDGLEAVQRAKELQPDLILLDIGLPNLNGLEAANRIRQVAPDAAIIFVTQNNDKDMVRAALSIGAKGYILKTDVGSELLPAVAGVLGGDDFVSSGIQGGSGETENAQTSLRLN